MIVSELLRDGLLLGVAHLVQNHGQIRFGHATNQFESVQSRNLAWDRDAMRTERNEAWAMGNDEWSERPKARFSDRHRPEGGDEEGAGCCFSTMFARRIWSLILETLQKQLDGLQTLADREKLVCDSFRKDNRDYWICSKRRLVDALPGYSPRAKKERRMDSPHSLNHGRA